MGSPGSPEAEGLINRALGDGESNSEVIKEDKLCFPQWEIFFRCLINHQGMRLQPGEAYEQRTHRFLQNEEEDLFMMQNPNLGRHCYCTVLNSP